MTRVTDEQVRKVIETELEDITLFLETAELVANEQLIGKGLSDDRLTKIKLYLAAHFLTLREKQLKSEKFGDASETYYGITGMNLKSSFYGQTALSLDTTGSLVNAGNAMAEIELL